MGDSNWSLVSPAKTGRSSPRTHKSEDLHISASKFAVLSVEVEEEEGEIREIGPLVHVVDSSFPKVAVEEDNPVKVPSPPIEGKKGKVLEAKGEQITTKGSKEKKAKSHDTNSVAMSTRSSRRHH